MPDADDAFERRAGAEVLVWPRGAFSGFTSILHQELAVWM